MPAIKLSFSPFKLYTLRLYTPRRIIFFTQTVRPFDRPFLPSNLKRIKNKIVRFQ